MSTVNVSLVGISATQTIQASRDTTIAELYKLAPKYTALVVGDCVPSMSATIGELSDASAEDSTLTVTIVHDSRAGCTCIK